MKPASFDYHAPTTVDEALALLEANGPDSRLLAGGQSLVPMMNFRLAAPPVIVDLNRIPDLAYIEDHGDVVCIGAMTRQRAVESSALVADKLPVLSAAIKLVGHLPTRSRGTIGGSIAHADPAAELPMVLQALDGAVVVRGPNGRRTIAASELFQDAMTTSIAADEILVEVRLPVMPAGAGYAVEEFARRHGDFAIAAVTAVILREGDRCARAPHRDRRHLIAFRAIARGRASPRAARAWRRRHRACRRDGGRDGRAAGRSAGIRGLSAAVDAGPDRARRAPGSGAMRRR